MKYFVVSDLHGYLTPLRTALEAAGFFDEQEDYRLVVCGDVLDRGGEAEALVDFLLDVQARGQLIYVLGNHEELLVQCLSDVLEDDVYKIASGLSHHYRNGTWNTLLQLSGMREGDAIANPRALVRRVKQSRFWRELATHCIDWYETEHYVFCHGWIPTNVKGQKPAESYHYRADWREADANDWWRARWLNGMEMACRHGVTEPDKTSVCGPWHTSYGHAVFEKKGTERGVKADFSPFLAKGILAIDGCTHSSGRVNCVVLED